MRKIILPLLLMVSVVFAGGGGMGFEPLWQEVPFDYEWDVSIKSDSGTYWFAADEGYSSSFDSLFTVTEDINKMRLQVFETNESTCDLYAKLGSQEYSLTDGNIDQDVSLGEQLGIKAVQKPNTYGSSEDCFFQMRLWKG